MIADITPTTSARVGLRHMKCALSIAHASLLVVWNHAGAAVTAYRFALLTV
jgi:hypothetical protein